MNTGRIIQAAKRVLSDLNEVDANVYRGTLKIDNKLAGVCFIDLGNKRREDFDDFQEKLISKEFYSNPGLLQWNYYLFHLNDQLGDTEVAKIESDDKYARKYVLSEEEFVDFFKIEEVQKSTQPNIVSEWKTALQEVDLQEVYSQETYVSIFERFANDRTIKARAVNTKNADEVEKIRFVDKLILKDNYRPYPKGVREFDFGKVNLFKGINGVGKTSVFEGIELMICGKSARNAQQTNPNGCLEAVFNGAAKPDSYHGSNVALYQSRDQQWYSSVYNRGNNLYNSFNRFNYFNADAAHSFASSKTEGEVMDALYSIVLGPEFGYIQERCNKMIDRIRPEYRRLKDSLDTAKKEISADKKIVNDYKEPESVRYIREKINKEVASIGFTQKGLIIENSSSQIEDLNVQLLIALQNVTGDNALYNSKSEFSAAKIRFDEKKKSFDDLLDKVKTLMADSTNLLREQKELEKRGSLLELALDYLSDPRYLLLDGLSEKIKVQERTKARVDFLSAQLDDIQLGDFKQEIAIADFEQTQREAIKKRKGEIEQLRKTIDSALEKMGKIEGLIKDIKAKGAAYLLADPQATECPMCNTSFERTLLEHRITQLLDSDEISVDKFQLDQQQLQQWTEEVGALEKMTGTLERVKNAYQSAFGSGHPMGKISDLTMQIDQLLATSGEISIELQKLEDTRAFAELSGKTEPELVQLKVSLGDIFEGELELDIPNLEAFKARLSDSELQLSTKKSDLEKNVSERYNKGLEIKILLGLPTELPTDAKAAEQKLEGEKKAMERYEGQVKTIESLIQLNATIGFLELKNQAETLKQSIQSYKDALNAEFLFKQAKERLEKNNKTVSDQSAKYVRFEKAYNRLVELTSDGATKRVEDFFKDNLNEVIDIFKSIHVPREFADLKFEDKRLTLIGEDPNDQRYITEISTGQRSALALAIFLSLNSKLANGPDLIMFDDPVAFIDDLNALSFLDYLRLHVLKSGKQIFFATANTRLAHLFEKKFAFLQEDFKQWHLDRNSPVVID